MKKLFLSLSLSIAFLATLLLSGCEQSSQTNQDTPSTSNASKLQQSLPDFGSYQDVKEKKQAFFSFLRPLVEQGNRHIQQEKALIEKWANTPKKLSTKEQQLLTDILSKYRISSEDPDEQLTLLTQRVQPLPPSLVLAQAANESAWGTSRFARQGNNLFGQWCFSKGCGIVPSQRNDGASHEVEVFPTPGHAIESYMRNLNSHPQYQALRTIRSQLIAANDTVSGEKLAEGLSGYSERGQEYIKEITAMIRQNDLSPYDEHPFGVNEPN